MRYRESGRRRSKIVHICMDEIYAIMAVVPFLGALAAWLRAKLHHQKHYAACSQEKGME